MSAPLPQRPGGAVFTALQLDQIAAADHAGPGSVLPLRSATGCRTAHSERTIAITSDGAEILTPAPFRR